MSWTFEVYGHPEPAGSKRAFIVRPKGGKERAVVSDANPNAANWKEMVASAAIRELGWPDVLVGPVRLTVAFYLLRPQGHYGSGRNAGRVRDAAPAYPIGRPDATKLLRGVEDALTGVLWRDDAQVVDQHVFKRYGEPERAAVTIEAIEAGAPVDPAQLVLSS